MRKLLSLIFAFSLLTSNLFAASLELDYMEGCDTDAHAQAEYVTNAGKVFQVNTDGTLLTSLVSYYKLEDANDYYSTNHGTNTSTTFSAGKVGNAGVFNGAAKIQLPNDIDWTAISVSFWFRNGVFTGDGYLLSKTKTTIAAHADIEFEFAWGDSGTNLKLTTRDANGDTNMVTYPKSNFTNGVWYHVVGVIDEVNNVSRIYINASNVASNTSATGTHNNLTTGFTIGSRGDNADSYIGDIDELAIWTKALSAQEVTDLYNSTNGQTMVPALQSYSEATIKTQGSYALKAVAAQTDSLNKTLTKTLSVHSDLTGVGKLRISDYALRTGSNYKIGLHDSGGTTTEYTPNIGTSNTWQTDYIDLSAVSDANKDDIDSIIITVTNADSANTMYLDYFGIYCGGGGGGSYTWAS